VRSQLANDRINYLLHPDMAVAIVPPGVDGECDPSFDTIHYKTAIA